MARFHRWLALSLLVTWSLSHAWLEAGEGKEAPRSESPAEKIRKALDQQMVLDYTGQSIFEAVEHFKEKTQLNFTLDTIALQQIGIILDPANPTLGPVNIKADKYTKVRTALQRMLNAFSLTYVILEDSVLITTEELGVHRQMRQRVSVSYKDVPLAKALKELARAHALSMVIDPRMTKEAQAPVTLEVEDATLETAVRLLAEIGGMKAVRMGNVLFVTSESRADKIRKEEQQMPVSPNLPVRIEGAALFPCTTKALLFAADIPLTSHPSPSYRPLRGVG
ncbi:MAG: hypothetical protein HY040_22080 [Planctomycetes bacterium]|nr:hypothetical protein [Planctomycetota bacterium]